MTTLGKALPLAAALGLAALAAGPAAAQGWYGDGYYGWRDHGWRGHRWGPPPPYGYYGYGAGETDIAICPPGYHLGRSARLCWPD